MKLAYEVIAARSAKDEAVVEEEAKLPRSFSRDGEQSLSRSPGERSNNVRGSINCVTQVISRVQLMPLE